MGKQQTYASLQAGHKKRHTMSAAKVVGGVSMWTKAYAAFRNWYVYAAGYRQLGLKADDLRMDEYADVETAISRLSPEDQYERIFRIRRALDLSMKHQILPKEEWTKPEEDVLYLNDLIEQARVERKERQQWDRL